MNDEAERLAQENKRLRSAVHELAVLNEISGVISSTMTIEEISQRIMKKVVSSLKAEEAAVFTFSEEAGDLAPKTFVRGKLDSSSAVKSKLDIRIAGWIAHHRKPLVINDSSGDTLLADVDLRDMSLRSILAVPISVKGKLIGALAVFNSLKDAGFSDDDIRLLAIIGAQSGQLMENARLYQEELRLRQIEGELTAAQKIQSGFLPKDHPRIAGYDIHALSIPAREVGGDYYDYIMAPSGKLFFTLGDVSGKGLPAALLMSTIQGQARSLVSKNPDVSPSGLIKELNLITCQMAGISQFATMVAGALHVESHRILLANAAHCYPLIIRSSGKIEEVCESSLMIGKFEQAEFGDCTIDLGAGDILALASDGVEEAMDSDEKEYGLERFRQSLAAHADLPAQDVCRAILQAVGDHRGAAEQSDDITMMIIKRV